MSNKNSKQESREEEIFEELPGSDLYSIRYRDRSGRKHSEFIGTLDQAKAALAARIAAIHLPKGVYEKVPGSKIYWIRYTGADGKLHRQPIGTLSAAKESVEARRVEKRQGKLPRITRNGSRKLTFAELVADANKFLESQRSEDHAYDTGLKFERMIPAFGKRDAMSITREEILGWLDSEAELHEWGDATRNRYVAAFSLVYTVAGPDGNKKLAMRPWSTISRLQEDNSRVRFLSPAEEAAITAVLRDRHPDYLPVFFLLIHTGARTSEMLRAEVGDYDPSTGLITIHQRKDKRKPKRRYVPATPLAIEAYNTLAAGKKKGDHLCNNREGGPLYELRYWLVPSIEAAGVTDFTPHDLRHTAASRWVMEGVPLAAVAKYLGDSVEMVMRYSHLQPEVNARAVEAAMSFYPKPDTNKENKQKKETKKKNEKNN
jgi:integrase